ncbi:MAG: HEAT repeat domain-containing protein [Phycisphaerae bacterium]|nr:HEAT repeat domain-containing protein [Tepidisphaeraceae bacterium]
MTKPTLMVLLAATVSACTPPAQQRGGAPKWTERQMPAPAEPPAPPPVRAERLDPAHVAAAQRELDAALESADPVLKCNALEVLQTTSGAAGRTTFVAALRSPQAPARFAAAMAIGQLRLHDAADELRRILNDPDPLVGVAVRFALHRLGDTRYSKDLQATASDPSRDVRGATAVALGMLGEPTATRVLRPMLRDAEPGVRLQAAEALWRLGQEDGMVTLIAGATSGYADLQCVSLLGLAAPRDRRVLGHVRAALIAPHVEAQLVAARAAGMLGSDMGYAIAAAGTKSKDPRQRFLAALALGSMGRTDAQSMLAELLKDRENAPVRLAAAQAILQLQAPSAAASGN